MDRQAGTWLAAFRLAVIASLLAAAVAVLVSVAGDVPQVAVVLPVIVVAFLASWVQSGRSAADVPSSRATAAPRASAAAVDRLVRNG